MADATALTAHIYQSPRHKTHYWQAGPSDGSLMIFLHGWPQIGLMWRTQMEAFASKGWHCVAPDMRGYGGSSAPSNYEAYALKEIVEDMVELHDHLGASPAIWIGHDLGSPVVGAIAVHHPERSRGTVFVSVPYFPEGFALPNLLPLVDRKLYPADKYPQGQWDYYHFYLTNFDQTVSDFETDIPATLSAIYRRGNPASAGQVYRSALVTSNGGWFGSAHRAPATAPDFTLWPAADFDVLVEAFNGHGFRPVNSWYLNDAENIAYAHTAPDNGRLAQPVLFINGELDGICNINGSDVGKPMRESCQNLSVVNLPAGHWLPLESKTELVEVIHSWLEAQGLTNKFQKETMMKHHTIEANGVSLHFVEAGEGPAVVFCHGFPAIWSSWKSQIEAVTKAGFKAIVPDMRGYGESSAPLEAEAYTPFQTVGDLVAILDSLDIETASIVGHDFGANVAWNAAMMRPDRFTAVASLSVQYRQPGGPSFLDKLRAAGKNDFYWFHMMKPEADQIWANAAVTVPGMIYWTSGEAPEESRWNPFDPSRALHRPAPPSALKKIDAAYISDAIASFTRTGFHGALNYYRAVDPFTPNQAAFAGAKIHQPSMFLAGTLDGLNLVAQPDCEAMRTNLTDLRSFTMLEGVGHWPQLEAPEATNAALIGFLRGLKL